MSQQDQAALEWSKANPKDPRSQHIQAKAWANQNPDDPRSEQILNQLSHRMTTPPPASPPPSNPFQTSVNQDQTVTQQTGNSPLHQFLAKAAQVVTGSMAGTLKAATLGNIDLAKPLGLDETGLTVQKASNALGNIAVGGLVGGAGPQAGNALGRVAIGAMEGGALGGLSAPSSPTDGRLNGAIHGAELGGTVGAGLEGLNGLLKGAASGTANIQKAYQMATGSPALQAEARGALGDTANSLRNSPIRNTLNDMLGKAEVEIQPSDFLGKTPQVDQILRNKIADSSQYGLIPDKLKLSGSELNSIRQNLDSSIPWKNLPYGSLSKQDITDGQGIEEAANKARGVLHSISPEVSDAFNQVSSNIKGATMLEKSATNPLNLLRSTNPDKMAKINALSQTGDGGGLSDYANQIRSAGKTAKNPVKSGILQTLKQAGKGVAGSLSGDSSDVNSPSTLSAILNGLK